MVSQLKVDSGCLSLIENNENYIAKNSNEFSRFEKIEKELEKVFRDEIESSDSILIFISDNLISKLAMFLSGEITRSCAVGISGQTASGKSTITEEIINTILDYANRRKIENSICRINTDDYYYDRSDLVRYYGGFDNFARNYDLDCPEAFELNLMAKHIYELLSGNNVFTPKYDMSGTAKRYDNVQFVKSSKIIITEGLFTLNEELHDVLDFKIYVDISKRVQKQRFFERAIKRNLGDSANSVYENALSKAKIYIEPNSKYADIILSGEAKLTKYNEFILKILNIIDKIYYKNNCTLKVR